MELGDCVRAVIVAGCIMGEKRSAPLLRRRCSIYRRLLPAFHRQEGTIADIHRAILSSL
jgi:hypothetical protein